MSSSDLIISARGLGKAYTIQQRDDESTAAETLLKSLTKGFKRTSAKQFWPLQDISFDVHRGDIVGIIGHNGAGKSTLLKVLSRITEPTVGEARIRGRIGSLIEVGTGFQPELTGRENIYLNGAILGMRRSEITARFDEIVDFSGVEKFLDTPVKRYSSGMYVRLAFAVAAHLDTEILLVDEVLSVGDAEFQKKSLGKMSGIASSGRTVLFVSHNLATMERLCNRGLLLHGGRLKHTGPLKETIAEYHRAARNPTSGTGKSLMGFVDYEGEHQHFIGADLRNAEGESVRSVSLGDDVFLHVLLESDAAIDNPTIVAFIDDGFGQNMLTLKSPKSGDGVINRLHGRTEIICHLPRLQLAPGNYNINLGLYNNGARLEQIAGEIYFVVNNSDLYQDGWGAHDTGAYAAPTMWRVKAA